MQDAMRLGTLSMMSTVRSVSEKSARIGETDAEAARLNREFEAFVARQRQPHHWTPELRAQRLALFSIECRKLWEAAGVEKRFATIDLLQPAHWLPTKYVAMSHVLLGLRDDGKLIAVGGPRGRGKTGMACGLIRAFCRVAKSARYARVRDFFDQLDGVPWEQKTLIKERFAAPELLVLDEVQVRDDGKQWQDNDLTTLIDRRYAARRATVLLSNLTPAALVANLGASIHRRLNDEGQILESDWQELEPLRRAFEADTSEVAPAFSRQVCAN